MYLLWVWFLEKDKIELQSIDPYLNGLVLKNCLMNVHFYVLVTIKCWYIYIFFMIPFFNLFELLVNRNILKRNILKRVSASKISPSLYSLLEIYLIASSVKKEVNLDIPDPIIIHTLGWIV